MDATRVDSSPRTGAIPAELSDARLVSMYECMSLIRHFEERLKRLVETGVPVGAVHYYIGQEAVAAGVCAALEPQDWISSTHRGHGHCIAKGVNVAAMMAELFGKVTGTNRGKGGSMHITDIRKRVLGVNPIVGAGVAHAVGAALSAKVRGSNEVAVAFFGDGAGASGILHESLNMAAIWKLPVVFVCENNGYGQATPVEYALCSPRVADRAPAYNMPGVTVDGQDVIAVWQAADRAVQRARAGDGPSLIECTTYRYFGHHQSDDTLRYRTRAEEEAARARDCLKRLRETVAAHGSVTLDQLDAADATNEVLVDEAVEFAKTSALPEAGELYTDVLRRAPAADRRAAWHIHPRPELRSGHQQRTPAGNGA
jgi:pyruvate dehydrogenase E1 component alpha subunit